MFQNLYLNNAKKIISDFKKEIHLNKKIVI